MPSNYDEVVKKNKQYLTSAQINALAAASKEYNISNAGRRAEAQATLRDQYDAGYRGLQNMGLAGAVGGQPTSGEVPRLEQQIKTPFDNYNQKLQQVENQRLSALGANYAAQTQAARAAAAAAAAERARIAAAEAESQRRGERYFEPRQQQSTSDSFIGPPTRQQWQEQQNRQNQYMSQLQAAASVLGVPTPNIPAQIKQTNATAAAKNNIVSAARDAATKNPATAFKTAPDAMKQQHAEMRQAESVLSTGKGYDTAADKNALAQAEKQLENLKWTRHYGGRSAVSDADFNAAQAAVDAARLKVEQPQVYAAFTIKNSPTASAADKSKATGIVASYQSEEMTKALGYSKPTMTDTEFQDNAKTVPDVRRYLDIIDSQRIAQENKRKTGTTGSVDYEQRDIDDALAELKKLGYTEDQARKFISDFDNNRSAKRDYDTFNDAFRSFYEHQGERPTKGLNNNETDPTYRAVNNMPDLAVMDYNSRVLDNPQLGPVDKLWTLQEQALGNVDYMTKEQRDAYNAIYEKDGIEAANKYASAIKPLVEMNRAASDDAFLKQLAKEHGVQAWALARATNLISNVPAMAEKLVTGAANLASDIATGGTNVPIRYSPDSAMSRASNWADIIQSEQSRAILQHYDEIGRPGLGKVVNFGYSTGTSMADSAIAMLISGMGAPWLTDVLFFSSAGNSAYKDAIERGGTQEQALAFGVLSGTAEALFEHVSIEHFLNDLQFNGPKAVQLIKSMLSQGGTEASEEVCTEIANILSDVWVMGDKSEFEQLKQQPGGERGAYMALLKNAGSAALGGLASGLGFGAISMLRSAPGRILQRAEINDIGDQVIKSKGVQNLVDTARLLGGEASSLADKVSKKETNANVGDLAVKVAEMQRELYKNEQNGVPRSNEHAQDREVMVTRLLDGGKMDAFEAKDIMDTIGTDSLSKLGYDVSSPRAFKNSYNAILQKYGIDSKAERMSSVGGNLFASRTGSATYVQTHPTGLGMQRSGEAAAQYRSRQAAANYTGARISAAMNVWANPQQGMALTMNNGTQVPIMPGNMTAVAMAEQERTNFQTRSTATKGRVTYAVAGMEARKGLTNEQTYSEIQKGLTKEARKKAQVYEKLADALGVNMVIHDVMTGTNGFIDEKGNMHVVLSGKQSVLRVAAHELTHWMKEHNDTGYASLREHLIKDVGQERFDRMLKQKAREYGIDMSTEKGRTLADDEVCAELCERMLSDTDALERFAEKDTETAKTLKEHLLKILNAIKRALKDVGNRDFGESWSDLIRQQDTIESWITGLQKAIDNANARSNTVEGQIAKTAGVTTVDQAQMDEDMREELFLDEDASAAESRREKAKANAEKGTKVDGITDDEMSRILSRSVYGDKSNYDSDDFKSVQSMLAQLVPEAIDALNGNADLVEVDAEIKTAVGEMLDKYYLDEGDHSALRELIPEVIAVDSTAKSDLKAQDTSLFQMSSKLKKALGRKVTLVGPTNEKFKSAMKLEELWHSAQDRFGLSDYQDFSVDTQKLLDFVQSQTAVRDFDSLHKSERDNIVTYQANEFVSAVDEMLAERVDKVIAEHSVDVIEYDMAGYRADLEQKGLMSKGELDELFTTMKEAVKYVKDHRAILDFGEELNTEEDIVAAKQNRAYLPYKQNADPHYKLALDFSTLCKKRILLQMIQERLQGKLKRSLSALETIAIRREILKLQKNGVDVEVACALCYVEAARMKSHKVIDEFLGVGMTKAERAANVEAEMRNYFAQKDKDIKKVIDKDLAKWKEDKLGKDWTGFTKSGKKVGAANASKDHLKAFGGQKLVDEYNAFAKGTRSKAKVNDAQEEIIKEAKRLVQETPEAFLSAESLAKMKKSNPDIFYAFVNKVRSATRSKALETDTFYSRGDIDMVDEAIIRAANQESGFRHQSWSDFMPIHLLDTMASVIEMSQRDAKMHAYTKVPAMVELLGNTGMMLNMSMIPKGATGLKADGTLDFDSVEGMDWETMMRLRDAFPDTAGNIAIGISDEQIRKLLDSPDIDYVIPYHASGMNQTLRTHMNIEHWVEYTKTQNEVEKEGWKEKHKKGKMKPPALARWFSEEDAKKAGTKGVEYMQKASEKYLDICNKEGWIPKFPQYLTKDADGNYHLNDEYKNYWKMLTDRKMVNHLTGNVIIQQAVKPKFNEQTVMDILKGEAENPTAIRNAAAADEIAGELAKTWRADRENANLKSYKAELNAFREASAVMAADRVKEDVKRRLAETRNSLDTDYMRLAKEYNPWDRAAERNLDRLVKQAAVQAGYDTPMLFHGTPSFGWTVYVDKNHSTPFIYTSTKSEVSAHYAGDRNYAFRRDIGQKYDGGDSLDSIIKDAKWVYQTNLRVPTDAEKANRVAADIAEATKVADKIDELWKDVSNEYPEDVSNALAGMADIFYTLRDGDVAYGKTPKDAARDLLLDQSAQKQFKKDIDWSLNYLERSREVFRDYYDKHRSEMGKSEKALFSYLMSYEVGDAAIDIQYGLGLLLDNDRVLQRVADGGFVDADNMRKGMDESHNIGAYKLYGNLGDRPFIFDADGGQFWALKVPEISDGYVDTDTVSKWALKNGYTSVVMKNIYDYGDKADNYVFFSSEQIKSADPVTYDDQGNIIPLSERFNQQRDDIRYDLDTDAIREAFTHIDTSALDKGLESLRNVTPGKGLWAIKDISRFLDSIAGGSKDLRDTLTDIFETPHRQSLKNYATGVGEMQKRVLEIGAKAGVCDSKGKHFDSKKSAAIQNIGEGFSNKHTDVSVRVVDADAVRVTATDKETGKALGTKDYTFRELRGAYGHEVADQLWSEAFDAAQKAGKPADIEREVNTQPYTLDDLKAAYPQDWQKLKTAADEFRTMYDEYIRNINNMLETIYPNASKYATVDKITEAIEKKQQRLADRKAAYAVQIENLQSSLVVKEMEAAKKKNKDTKAYRQLVDQANQIKSKMAEALAEIEEYEANVKDELEVMGDEKTLMQNAEREGDSLGRMHRLEYRSDYFHHFTEMTSGVQNLKSIFTGNTDISPSVVGKSDQTKAKSRFAGFFQQRKGGDYTADALNGMLRYGQLAEYKLAFDPFAAYLRDVEKQVANLDKNKTNRNNLIRYIQQWTNTILGKSHTIDRALVDSGIGMRSKLYKVLSWINSRVIQNTLLWNMRSALVQISNVTNAKGIVTNNLDWANGLRKWALAARGNREMQAIMNQSTFLASRYMDNLQLTDSVFKSAKNFAGWMLGALDEVSAKATWWAAYTQYQRNPNAKVIKNAYRTYANAIDYADDVTRRTHAGRGVGELAPAMTSRVISLVAPFQVEVNNTYQLLKDNVKQKNVLGLISTGVSVFVLNTIFEAIVGSTPLGFDFIRAIIDIAFGIAGDDPDDDKDDYDVKRVAQRIAGEFVGGLPYANQIVGLIGKDNAEKILGSDTDVTRYENTQIGLNAMMNTIAGISDIGSAVKEGKNLFTETNFISDIDDLLNIIMPMGAKQMTRTAEGLMTVAKGYGSKADKEGNEKVQFVADQDLVNWLHAGLFGKWSLTEASEFFGEKRFLPQLFGKYDGPKSSIGKAVDAKEYKAALETGINGHQYFDLKYDLSEYSTAGGKREEMMNQKLTADQKAKLDALLVIGKNGEAKAEGGLVYQKNSDGEWKVKADYTSSDMFDLSLNGDKIYTGTVNVMEKTGLPQDQAALAASMWDQAKDADDSKKAFRDMLRDNKNLTAAQKEALDLQYCGNKYSADYLDPELYDLSVTNRTVYEKAKEAKAQGIPVQNYVGLYEKKQEYSGENRSDYMRQEIMDSNLSTKQKELLDDLLVSDKGRNPDYSSPAWFEISMLGGGQYKEAKDGEKVGLKPETYLTVYKKWKTLDAKDENGNTRSGLKKKRAKEYLDSLPISAPVYDYIWTAVFGYKSR